VWFICLVVWGVLVFACGYGCVCVRSVCACGCTLLVWFAVGVSGVVSVLCCCCCGVVGGVLGVNGVVSVDAVSVVVLCLQCAVKLD